MSYFDVNPSGTIHHDDTGMGAGMMLGIILAVLVLLAIVFFGPRMFVPAENTRPISPAATAAPVAPSINVPLPTAPAGTATP